MIAAYRPLLEDRIVPYDNIIHESGPLVQAKLVGAPVPMCASEISELNKNKDYANYIIDLEFEVSEIGRANNIKIVSSNAPIAVNRLFRRLVHHYRFRPSLVDGKPATEKMQLHQTFGETVDATNQFAVGMVATIHGCNLLATI
ncbi:MAG: hypothetical protein JKY88_13640 [Pseudomonadales bacterium]|nr:hypothetical protein [Pseudomonadales bacterium]